MSEITSVHIEYRDDCFQTISLVAPIPGEYGDAIAVMVLTMRNGEKCTPDRVTCRDALGETVACLEKRKAR